MKKKKHFSVPSKYVLLILSILCLGACVLSFTEWSIAKPLKNLTGYLLVPAQKGLNQVGLWFTEKSDEMVSLREVMAENEELKAELNRLMEENSNLAQERNELDQLRSLYNLEQTYEYPMLAAKVIGKDPGNWFHVFQIDKGSADGVQVDMNVLAGNGLAGIVISVAEHSSMVRSIIDDASTVTAKFAMTSDQCDVLGDLMLINSGRIRVERILKDAAVGEGYTVVTSHISSKFLPGILIGYVSEITLDANNLTKSGYLTPVVDFEHLEYVLVITKLKEQ
jgi:rod shape-determining protein MreC